MAKQFTTIDQCEDAIRKAGGFISHAAKQLGISQPALSKRIGRSARLKQVLDDTREQYLDLAESKLLKKIQDEDLGAICFYLKCKGKERGYIERQIVDANINDKEPLIIKRAGKCQK